MTNKADLNLMQHSAASYLGLHHLLMSVCPNTYVSLFQIRGGTYPHNILLISSQKHMLYSLEAPFRGTSDEYPQYMCMFL